MSSTIFKSQRQMRSKKAWSVSRLNQSDEADSPMGAPLYRYLPEGSRKVVSKLEDSSRGIWK